MQTDTTKNLHREIQRFNKSDIVRNLSVFFVLSIINTYFHRSALMVVRSVANEIQTEG